MLHFSLIVLDFRQAKRLAERRKEEKMEKYDYEEAVLNDVKEYIGDTLTLEDLNETPRDQLEERLYDELFISDSVTGNGSGSYYCNAWKAEEALYHNLDLAREAYENFDGDASNFLKDGPESADVTIRCYLLPNAIKKALDDLIGD